jgi:serine/threonine protein kinase
MLCELKTRRDATTDDDIGCCGEYRALLSYSTHPFLSSLVLSGGELFDYVVEKGTLTEEEASKIVRKVTSAIAFMHSLNYIHRDLKPENLLLKRVPTSPYEDIDVKIIDFGLSKVSHVMVQWRERKWFFVLLQTYHVRCLVAASLLHFNR